MEVNNSVRADKKQTAGFFEPGPDGPIYMLNLLKFKDKAEYEDGRETDLTGAEAYEQYTNEVAGLLVEFGGALMWTASVECLRIGKVDELWDKVAIAMYPSRLAMVEMMRSEKMAEIGAHRTAGLLGQLNIETVDSGGLWETGA